MALHHSKSVTTHKKGIKRNLKHVHKLALNKLQFYCIFSSPFKIVLPERFYLENSFWEMKAQYTMQSHLKNAF